MCILPQLKQKNGIHLKKEKTQTYGFFQLSPSNSPSILHRLNITPLGANSTFVFVIENISPEQLGEKTK